MQILPVIDLMRGEVVRGIGGRRREYRPLTSPLCPDARPATLAAALVSRGFPTAYLADLDAIEKGDTEKGDITDFLNKGDGDLSSPHSPSSRVYADILRAGLDLWIDAGLTGPDDARLLARFEAAGRAIAGIVAGLESLADPPALADVVRVVGPTRLVFSLDLKHGAPLAGPAWNGLRPEQIAAIALRAGVRRMIVLDLADVGSGAGVSTPPLCRRLRSMAPQLQLIAGGGVRGPADLEILTRAGCDAALVASALHDGRLTRCDYVASRFGTF